MISIFQLKFLGLQFLTISDTNRNKKMVGGQLKVVRIPVLKSLWVQMCLQVGWCRVSVVDGPSRRDPKVHDVGGLS